MGQLTQSLGVAGIEDGQLSLVLDIRHPNDITPDEVLSRLGGAVKAACGSWETAFLSVSPYLFADPESPFIRQLVGIYRDITGDTHTPPQVTGGGTYARMFKNHVAFGPLFPTDPPLTEGVGTLHQANEATAVQSMDNRVPSFMHSSTQAVSGLNSQDKIFLILVTSQFLNFS